MRRLISMFAPLLALQLLVNGPAVRADGGALEGKVTDVTGAIVTGARVVAVVSGSRPGPTSPELEATTDLAGTYRFANLSPGVYDIHADGPGFSPAARRRISVTAGTTAKADVVFLGKCANGPPCARTKADGDYCRIAEKFFARLTAYGSGLAPTKPELDGRVVLSAERLPPWLVRAAPKSVLVMPPEKIERLAEERGCVAYLAVFEFEERDCCIAIWVCPSARCRKPPDGWVDPNTASPEVPLCYPYRFEASLVGDEWLTPEE
jgi:hypothetical protein